MCSSDLRYDTILMITAKTEARVRIDVYSDTGDVLEVGFTDAEGQLASETSPFYFVIQPRRTVMAKLALPVSDQTKEVLVRTGWATVRSREEVDASMLIRITSPAGDLLSEHTIPVERIPWS